MCPASAAGACASCCLGMPYTLEIALFAIGGAHGQGRIGMRLPTGTTFRLLATLLTIVGILLSSAPPQATPRAQAMAGPARPVAAGDAALGAAPTPRVLSSVPVDSPAVPHPTPPPPSLPAKAKSGAIGNASSQATLLLLPRGASGASDKLWRYRNGAWIGITLP